MRSLFIVTIVFLAGVFSSTFAQTKTVETKTTRDTVTGKTTTTVDTIISETEDVRHINNMITINPLKFIVFYNLSYYRAFSPYIAVGVGLQMPTLHDFGGFGASGEMRIYPSGKALRGFYIAPNVSYNRLTTSFSYPLYDNNGNYTGNSSSSAATTVTTIGVLLGWQWFPGDEFAIGLGIGLDDYFVSGSADGQYIDFGAYSNGAVPALRFDIGYAWQ
jgi:hypothetical protein